MSEPTTSGRVCFRYEPPESVALVPALLFNSGPIRISLGALARYSQLSLDGGRTWYYSDQPMAELAAAGLRAHADCSWEILPGTLTAGAGHQILCMSRPGPRPPAPAPPRLARCPPRARPSSRRAALVPLTVATRGPAKPGHAS